MDISQVKTFTQNFENEFEIDSRKRRELLIETMSDLESKGTDCSNCPGFCCTYYHNSMQATPLEAIEVLIELIASERLDDELISKLKANAKKYRLDNEITDGHGHILRRFYTCPFFNDTHLGCSLSRGNKPYGCLAFNATEKNVSVEGKCSSQVELLETRDKEFCDKEHSLNDHLKSSLNLYWDKKPLPQALIELMLQMSN